MDERAVVTCFLRHEGAVLLLKRSSEVDSHEGKWDAVAGHAGSDPDRAARQEIREETGLDPATDVTLVRRGESFSVVDGDTRWLVHPFLFDCESRAIEPNWETSEVAWVAPTAIYHRETVPGLWRSYDRVRPTVETVATDQTHGAAYISVRALEVLRDEAAVAALSDASLAATEDLPRSDRADNGWSALATMAQSLLSARPSMSVVRNRVNRVMYAAREARTPRTVEHVASAAIADAVTADRRTADRAAARIDGARVATLSRSGTVLDALRTAEPEAVLVAESRPGREGIGVAEMLAEDTDVTLSTDAGFAHALAEWDADVVLVGADAVLSDGRVLNKVGTRAAAMAGSYEGISVLVAAAADKLTHDETIDLEPRDPSELFDGDGVTVRNPTFDVTPPSCVDAVLTERGALDVDAVRAIAAEHRRLSEWDDG